LGDLGENVVHEDFDQNLTYDNALYFWFIVLWRQAELQNDINDLAVVFWINLAIGRYGGVRLDLGK
jgi:hypothetical protein